MITGAIAGSVDVLAELKDRGVPVYAITNGFVETFPPRPPRRWEFRGFTSGRRISSGASSSCWAGFRAALADAIDAARSAALRAPCARRIRPGNP